MPFERGKFPAELFGVETQATRPATSSIAALNIIRQQIDQVEADLIARDRRIEQLQGELQETQNILRAEQLRQKQRAAEDATQDLSATAARAQELDAAVRQRDARIEALTRKERELVARIQALAKDRAKAASTLTEMMRQVEEQQRRTRELEEQLSRYEHARQGGPQIATAETPVVSTRHRWVLAIGAVLALAASVGLGVNALPPQMYRASGVLVVPAGDAQQVIPSIIRPDDPPGLQATPGAPGEQTASIHLSLEGLDADEARRRVDEVGQRAAMELQVRFAPASQPAYADQIMQLSRRLVQIDERLRAASQPATAAVADPGLLDRWEKAVRERREIGRQLDALRPRLTPVAIDEATLVVDPERIAAAERADARLQADLEALTLRQQRLAELLRSVMDEAQPALDGMIQAAETGERALAEHLAAASEDDVREALTRLNDALVEIRTAIQTLRERWGEQQHATQTAGLDALAIHAAIESAARQFNETLTGAMTRIRDTLDRLGLEGDQPTKRIVLRNMLARQLQGAFDASTAAGTAARRVYPSDHAEIAAGVTGLAGIRGQVEDARARIAANVRQAVLAEKRAAAEEMLSLARAEFDRLTRRATELDDAIAAATEQAVMLLTRSSLESNDQRQQLALVRERGELLEQLASIRARQAIQLASAPPPVQYIPASVVALPRITPPTLMRAGALAAIPLLAGGAIACSWILFLWWRRSRQTADAYVRMLTAPREGDAPPAQ